MSCGCKRKIEIEDKYGVDEEENIFQKSVRNILKILFMGLSILFTLIIAPVLVIISFYKIFFGNNKIALPSFLGKYLKETNG